MKILLHDFSGHPFQLQLAEELARRGSKIEHIYCGSIPTVPQAASAANGGQGGLRSRAISLSKPIEKGDFVSRFFLERQYGNQLAAIIRKERPDMVLMSNTSVDSLAPAARAIRQTGAALVFWVQDLYGEAALRILPQKLGFLGKLIGWMYRYREDRLLAGADFLVSITDDFARIFHRAGIPDGRWITIPNWAPLDKIEPRNKINPWSIEQEIQHKTVFLYSGTLGFKHNPSLLLALAAAFKGRDDAILVVNSQGDAADWLRQEAKQKGLTPWLRVNGFQPFDRISDVLGAADVLLAILEPEAGEFSVPSKVLSNHCAARPQLLAVPENNLVAKIVRGCGSGLVCDPKNSAAFVAAGLSLLADAEGRARMGQNARAYALQNFQIERVADQFESVFAKALINLQHTKGK